MREEDSSDMQFFKIIFYVVIFLALLLGGGLLLLPLGGTGVLLWMLLTVAVLFFLIKWHAGCVIYRCSYCGQPVKTSMLKNVFFSEEASDELCSQCKKKNL